MSLPLLCRPLVISGPSGVGKSTFLRHLIKDYPWKFELMISHTSRHPRPGEIHGINYYFVTPQFFEQMIEEKRFIEYKRVHANWYGSSIGELERICKTQKTPTFDIEGLDNVKYCKEKFRAHCLFIMPSSMEELEKRLRGRKSETENALQLRLENARREIDAAEKSGIYNKEKDFIINAEWEASYKNFISRLNELYNLSGPENEENKVDIKNEIY